jgi:hypothetical protein
MAILPLHQAGRAGKRNQRPNSSGARSSPPVGGRSGAHRYPDRPLVVSWGQPAAAGPVGRRAGPVATGRGVTWALPSIRAEGPHPGPASVSFATGEVSAGRRVESECPSSSL